MAHHSRGSLQQTGEAVQHERPGDGDVKTRSGTDHGDLDEAVDQVERLARDA